MSDKCKPLTQDRIRYFTGRHLTAADFKMEQNYHRSHHQLHNRVMHGWGIACGLQVIEHTNPDCKKDHVIVTSGIAIDCCGHEIVLCEKVVPKKIDWTEAAPGKTLLLCLSYCQEEVETVPVIFDGGACSDPREEASRYRDSYRLHWHWVLTEDLIRYGWRQVPDRVPSDPKAHQPYPRKDCGDPYEDDACDCSIDCPKEHCIPLALVYQAAPDIEIRTHGRPQLRPAWRHLTHINWYNWPHGGEVDVDWLKHNPLKVSFDRRLQPNTGEFGGTGINRVTFTVRYGGVDEVPETAPSEKGPQLHDHVVTYQIEPHRARDIIGDIVFVTIHCDFVLDCHGEPVDGNHLGGLVPSGDGVAGGKFESWFLVTR